jgi:Tol biopolymer transport system component
LRNALEGAVHPAGTDGVVARVAARKRRRAQVRRVQLAAAPVLAIALIAGLLTASGDEDTERQLAITGGSVPTTALVSSTSAVPGTTAASVSGAPATKRPRSTTTTRQMPSDVRGGIAIAGGRLYVMQPDGSGLVELPVRPDETPSVGDADWNRDGTRIVFVTMSKYGGDMRTVRRDGSDVQIIPGVTGLLRTPRFSPDGEQIVYVSTDMYGSTGRLHLINADGSGARLLSSDPTDTSDLSPAWAPDGSRVVFSTRPLYGQQGPTTLAVLNVRTGKRTPLPLPAGVEVATDPSWSPDGRRIAFTARSHDWRRSDVWVMDADGADPVRLTTTGVDAMPDWSPGGGWLVFVHAGDVWTMHADGSAPISIADLDVAGIYAPSWR